jgi:hypothetical protein
MAVQTSDQLRMQCFLNKSARACMPAVLAARTRNVAAQVTGVGIDPYGVTVVDDAE